MATTREQAEAYSYENRRRATTLIRDADEALRDPRRRLNRALAGGLAIGTLIVAVFGVVGWLGGGRGPQAPKSGAVLVSGTGDRYVVTDGVAHPALNLASALLVGGGQLTTVKESALAGLPRGMPVGIPLAPDALPTTLSRLDWTVCLTSYLDGVAPEMAMYVGMRLAASEEATVLATGPDGRAWLLSGGHRFGVPDESRNILGLRRTRDVALPAEVLATVPEGPQLDIPPAPPGTGDDPSVDLPVSAKVGDLVHSDGPNPQYHVVYRDGLVTVSELVYTLMTAHAGHDFTLPAGEAASAPQSSAAAPDNRLWPDRRPVVAELARNQPLCVSTPPGSTPGDAPWQAVVTTPPRLPAPSGMRPVAPADGSKLGLLSKIYLVPGTGALVRASTAAGTAGTYTLVTDTGTAYPFGSGDEVQRLRYDPAQAPSVPQPFVDLLPRGPILTAEAAAREHRGDS
jgi:type VII secretion protein EccB